MGRALQFAPLEHGKLAGNGLATLNDSPFKESDKRHNTAS
jgi:hypothetical protein